MKRHQPNLRGAITVVLGVTCGAGAAPPEDRVTGLRQRAVEVRSIDPGDEDFSDFEPLGAAIGDARVLLLGEATHGDGATFLAKARLIKYLHQRKGFDVLAWEAGFYECAVADRAMTHGESWRESIEKALPLWAHTTQCQPLFNYIRSTRHTDHPIALVGMSWYTYGDSALFDDLVRFFEAVDAALPTIEERRALRTVRQLLGNLDQHRRPDAVVRPPELAHLDSMIDRLKRDRGGQLARHHGRRDVEFMRTALENLSGFVQYWYTPQPMGGVDDDPLGIVEGRNVLFLANDYFPGRKLIVWAHNGHIARASAQVKELETRFKFAETITTGQRVHDGIGDAMYSIGFTSYGGRSNGWWNEARNLPPPPDGSLEHLFHRVALDYAFLDLRGLPTNHWLREPLVACLVSYAPMRADWTQVYDGVFFIDAMSPSTRPKEGP